MKKTFKRLLLLISLATFALSAFSVLQHWQYQETFVDITKTLKLNVDGSQIEAEIVAAIQTSEFDDARMYLEIAKDNNYQINFQKYQDEILRKDTQLKKITHQVSNFVSGFAKGKGSDMAGLAGAVTADFTVVGDVRDLRQEYKNHSDDKNVNELIVLLSGVGVGLTALTVSSMGTAAPAKTGISVIKVAVKMKKITARFQKQLLKLARKVFDWSVFRRLIKQDNSIKNIRLAAKQAYKPKAIKPLKTIAKQINNIRKSTSTIDTLHLLKYVENSDDLRRLEKISLKQGSKTKGLMKLVGKGVLGTVRVLRKTAALIFSIFSAILSGFIGLSLLVFRRVY